MDRTVSDGRCGFGSTLNVALKGLHFYEEPFLSGTNGSGTVFFSGCSLGCVYCQNYKISHEKFGLEISIERLAEIFLEQKERGAHNINLVTGSHFVPSIYKALQAARHKGLDIPVIWNSSAYEKPETLEMLKDLVDIWLPDLKTLSKALAKRFMNAPDYPDAAKAAIDFMVKNSAGNVFENYDAAESRSLTLNCGVQSSEQPKEYEGEGVLMKSGVVVRHLVIPGHADDSKAVLRYLYENYGDDIWISLMSQYTPVGFFADKKNDDGTYPELFKKVSRDEYDDVVDYAISLGIEKCMIQEEDVANESFIPDFDGSGVAKKSQFEINALSLNCRK